MKLMKLEIRNFKGIREYDLDICGQSASVFGDNATGKTSLYDAFLWLLFGKDSAGRADFSIKPIGRDMQGVDVEVTGMILPDDGAEIKLSRVYSEVWSRKRGDVSAVFTGHTTSYFVDDLPVTLAVYKRTVDSLVPEDTFRVLTNPLHFSSAMKWQDRRRMLFDTFGGIADADIASEDERFVHLLNACGRYTVDEYKASTIKLLRKANEQLRVLPTRIDEASRAIMEDDDTTPFELELNREHEIIRRMTAEKQAGKDALADETTRIEAEIREIKGLIAQTEAKETARRSAERDEAMTGYLNAHEELRRQLGALDLGKIEYERRHLIAEEARLTGEMDALRSRYAHIASEEWNGNDTCPTCGRAFDPASVKKAQEAFYADRQAKLDEINREGGAKKETRERISGEISVITIKYNAAVSAAAEYKKAIESLQKPDLPPEGDEYKAEKAKLNARLEEACARLTAVSKQKLAQFEDDGMGAHLDRVNELNASIKMCEVSKLARARCAELEAQQAELADHVGEYEEMIALCEEWTRVRASRVQESINRHFELVTWRLYKEQINGGMEECCEALLNGVPYADLNGAAKINAGLDIIGAFAEATGKTAPVFVDNAESVTDLYTPEDVQTIRLVVSEADKQLRLQK